jgi:hypothetical protein
MAFKTFTPGVLTASDVNTFLMRQAVITCTSSTRPASPNEGMTIYETDTKRTLVYSGTAWIPQNALVTGSWTPIIGGTGWNFGTAVTTVGRFIRIGPLVHIYFLATFDGSAVTAGTGSLIFSGIPVNFVTGRRHVGNGWHDNPTIPRTYPATVLTSSSQGFISFRLHERSESAVNVGWNAITSTAIAGGLTFSTANGAEIGGTLTYEAA